VSNGDPDGDGDVDVAETKVEQSTDGTDGDISQDDDELTESSESAETCTMNSEIEIDGESAVPVQVTYTFDAEDDDFPVDLLSITRTDTQTEVDINSLSPEIVHSLMFACVHDYNSAKSVDECDYDMNEAAGEKKGDHSIETVVSTADEDEIPVLVWYSMEDYGNVEAVAKAIIRDDNGEDILSQLSPEELKSVEEECHDAYDKWAKEENDEMAINAYMGNRMESFTSRRKSLTESAKIHTLSLELPIDDIHDPVGDVDVTVSYDYEYTKTTFDEPGGTMIDIKRVVRDDTGEDITASLNTAQIEELRSALADIGDRATDDSTHDPYQEWKDSTLDEDQEDDLSADAYLDKRVADYARDAGPGLTKGTYVAYGKTFDTYVFDTQDAANAFMEENSGWSYIGEDKDGKYHVAKDDDTGEVEECMMESDATWLDDAGLMDAVFKGDDHMHTEFLEDTSDYIRDGEDYGSQEEAEVDLTQYANKFLEQNDIHSVKFTGVDMSNPSDYKWQVQNTGIQEDEHVIKIPRDQQKSLENEIDVGGRNGPEQQQAYLSRMKALAGLK
jgi:hypothetical protein